MTANQAGWLGIATAIGFGVTIGMSLNPQQAAAVEYLAATAGYVLNGGLVPPCNGVRKVPIPQPSSSCPNGGQGP